MKWKRLIGRGLIPLLLVLCLAGGMQAAEKGVFKGIERFSGDTDGKRMFMEGANLEYFQGETYIRFAVAEIVEEEDGARIVTFSGNVALVHEDLKVNGERFRYHTEEKSGVFTGGVVLEREEVRNDQGEVEKDGIKLVCDALSLQTKDKAFTATGEPFIEHKDFQGSGAEISYVDAAETLTIKGGFYLLKEKEEIRGESISFDLKQKVFTAERGEEPIEVIFEIEDDEEEPAEEGSAEAASAEEGEAAEKVDGVLNGKAPEEEDGGASGVLVPAGTEEKLDGSPVPAETEDRPDGVPVPTGMEDDPSSVVGASSNDEAGAGEAELNNGGEATDEASEANEATTSPFLDVDGILI